MSRSSSRTSRSRSSTTGTQLQRSCRTSEPRTRAAMRWVTCRRSPSKRSSSSTTTDRPRGRSRWLRSIRPKARSSPTTRTSYCARHGWTRASSARPPSSWHTWKHLTPGPLPRRGIPRPRRTRRSRISHSSGACCRPARRPCCRRHLRMHSPPSKPSWKEVRKRARVLMVLDVSGSMSGQKLELMKRGAAGSLDLFLDDDELALWSFGSGTDPVAAMGPVGPRRAQLSQSIWGLLAGGGRASTTARGRPSERSHLRSIRAASALSSC